MKKNTDSNKPIASAGSRLMDTLKREMAQGGMSMELKQKLDNGELANASNNQFDLLKTKSNIATIAQNVKDVDPIMRTKMAIDLKDYGNTLYSDRQFSDAMSKYVECLACANFDSDSSDNNVDTLVVPVLCNLAACSIQMRSWVKGIQFCEQALKLRPSCMKAQLRMGICLLNDDEADQALEKFQKKRSS